MSWQNYLFITFNIVLFTAVLLDAQFGAHPFDAHSTFYRIAKTLTNFGESDWLIVASVYLLIEGLAGRRVSRSTSERYRAIQIAHLGGYLLLSIIGSGIAANLVKRIIGRARPVHFEEWSAFGFSPFDGHASFASFPSGHATTIGAFFIAMAFLFPRYRWTCVIVALWLASTRVIVGAHYPSDVVAGLALGGWFSFMLANVYSRYGLLFRQNEKGWPTLRCHLFEGKQKPGADGAGPEGVMTLIVSPSHSDRDSSSPVGIANR